ncbi:MAG: hypothetical protein KA275_03775 [Chitinophagaceae bacterium]|nr:hypothetical protein [Chitinophagaceae bacterium]
MLFLIISIILNSYIGLIFKFFEPYKVNIPQTIILNYWICVITGVLFSGEIPISKNSLSQSWFYWAIFMGILFISIFNIIGISTQKVGATITQAANKLSLAIPVLFSIIFYQEKINELKLLGIILAFISVILVVWKKKENNQAKSSSIQIILPILLFIGSGTIDTITKFVEKNFITSASIANSYLITTFLSAAIVGSIFLIYKNEKIKLINIKAALILGIPNYFSIYFLIKALQIKTLSSSAIIPINNISILILVSIVGIFLLNEKISKLNFLGLLLALLSISLIYLGDK